MSGLNILILQHGNYAEAYHRFQDDGPETYRDQRQSVDYVAALAAKNVVTTLAICDDEHDVVLTPRLRSIGVARKRLNRGRISSILSETKPDVFICRTPHLEVLRQARAHRIQTLPCFADIFQTGGLRTRLRHLVLRFILLGSNFPCVANHSLNASRSIATCLGYPRERIVPWDWSRIVPSSLIKARVADPHAPRAFFAGAVSVDKGIADCLLAIRDLHTRGLRLSMSFAGRGDLLYWQSVAEQLGVAHSVKFLGLISNDQVRDEMQAHDIVVVPSRHSYSEGLPNTIYEALASRAALIISDHPAFVGRLRPNCDCLVFKASQAASLADSVARLCNDNDLYARLSHNSLEALNSLYVGIEWIALLEMFLKDPKNSTGWVGNHSLEALNL